MLARMKLIEKPVEDEAHIFTGNIEPQFPGGKWVYEAKELKIGYDGRALLELSLRIRRGQKIAVIGDNGIGKSTFLKTVAGLIPPIKGTSQLGSLSLIHISEPTRQAEISYAVFCLKKKKNTEKKSEPS